MNATSHEILAVLLRATIALSVSALVVEGLIRWLRPRSIVLQRAAWLLVLVQGVVWGSMSLNVPCPAWLVSTNSGTENEVAPAIPAEVTSVPLDMPFVVGGMPDTTIIESPGLQSDEVDWRRALLLTWIVGMVGLTTLWLAAYGRFLFRCAGSRPAREAWAAEWEALLAREGVRRRIPLHVSDRIGPVLCWTPWGYRLVVPSGLWSELNPDQRAAVLSHELAHFRRGDLWRNLVAQSLGLVHWFNPAAWWAASRFVALAEWACDREAAGRHPTGPVEYARALLRVGAGRDSFSPCAATVRGGSLAVRIRQLLTVSSLEDSIMKKTLVAIVILAMLGLNVFRVQLVAQEPEGGLPIAPTAPLEPLPGNTSAPPGNTKHVASYSGVAGSYVIEPPDVLKLQLDKMVPRPPYRVSAYDVLQVFATGVSPEFPISNFYLVEAEGTIDLGPTYGRVKVAGKTIADITKIVEVKLLEMYAKPKVSVQLARATSFNPVTGNYLVGPDGTINLRQYGSVHVAGKTVAQAAKVIEGQLQKSLQDPVVSVDVTAINSKVYYIITLGGPDKGDSVDRVPYTGNETALDALAQLQGITQISGKHLWIARPASAKSEPGVKEQILPIDWAALARGAGGSSNPEIRSGDRLYISDKPLTELTQEPSRLRSPPSGASAPPTRR
ncbi:MAG: polysaccharide biosynthesis/export family protein [Pirellulales bacterium]|nr:polysaccharide biosynthesis/export family protein [Pirellulales bacterium]